MNNLEILESYKKLVEKKNFVSAELSKQEGILAEAKNARDLFLESTLRKYGVSTIEELVALREKKIQEASSIVEQIKADCPEVFNR